MYKYIIILICIIFILHYLQNFIEIFTGKYPDIKIIENLISEKECDILIKLAKPTLKTSRVFNPDTKKSVLHSERNSKNTFLPYNNLIDKIYKKLESITNIPLYNYEVLQVTNYIKGQYYRPHYDNIEKYNIRTKTLIIYLSDSLKILEVFFMIFLSEMTMVSSPLGSFSKMVKSLTEHLIYSS